MKVILNQDVEQLGQAGEIVDVAPGYSRNYLIPRGLAIAATTRSVKQLEHRKRLVGDRIARERKSALGLKNSIETMACKIAREAGEEDKLFGSVTTRDIAAAIADEGFELDHRNIKLNSPIKHLGIYKVEVKLAPEVLAEIKVWVVAK